MANYLTNLVSWKGYQALICDDVWHASDTWPPRVGTKNAWFSIRCYLVCCYNSIRFYCSKYYTLSYLVDLHLFIFLFKLIQAWEEQRTSIQTKLVDTKKMLVIFSEFLSTFCKIRYWLGWFPILILKSPMGASYGCCLSIFRKQCLFYLGKSKFKSCANLLGNCRTATQIYIVVSNSLLLLISI